MKTVVVRNMMEVREYIRNEFAETICKESILFVDENDRPVAAWAYDNYRGGIFYTSNDVGKIADPIHPCDDSAEAYGILASWVRSFGPRIHALGKPVENDCVWPDDWN